jgi:hypothetical protein
MPPVLIGVTIKFVGASGTVPNNGVTATADDAQEDPTELSDLILMLYKVLLLSPVIVKGL